MFIVERMEDDIIIQLSEPVNEIISIIDSNQFKVVSSYDKDPNLKNNWLSGDINNQLTSLLETLYYLRCNLFHGEKEYSDNQISLLRPSSVCLSIINKEIELIFSKLNNAL